MQFVCEFALGNARNSALELQKCKHFLGEDSQTPLLSQTWYESANQSQKALL